MFGRHILRSFRGAWGVRGLGDKQGNGLRRPNLKPLQRTFAAAGAGAGGIAQLVARTPWNARLAVGLVSGGAATAACNWRGDEEVGPFETAEISWVRELAEQPGLREMLIPGQMLRKHPVGQLIAEDDHLVSDNSGGRLVFSVRNSTKLVLLGWTWVRLSHRCNCIKLALSVCGVQLPGSMLW
eukprot:GHRR01009503.1.p1 GENE.GHRR01009503.1~~GHRR01009503.1.p1  ORF type:complete len:183 (+),score=32.34 GHRR01009503.1:236-784(+)